MSKKLTEKQRVWMIDMMTEDSAGSLIQPNMLERRIITLSKTAEKNFKISKSDVQKISDELESDSGYMVKDSTLQYIIEKLVNEII